MGTSVLCEVSSGVKSARACRRIRPLVRELDPAFPTGARTGRPLPRTPSCRRAFPVGFENPPRKRFRETALQKLPALWGYAYRRAAIPAVPGGERGQVRRRETVCGGGADRTPGSARGRSALLVGLWGSGRWNRGRGGRRAGDRGQDWRRRRP